MNTIKNVQDFFDYLNLSCDYVILGESQNEYYILLSENIYLKKYINFRKVNSFVYKLNFNKDEIYTLYLIPRNKNFLDWKWEKCLFEEKEIKDGKYYPSLNHQIYLSIFIEEIYNPVFRYSKKMYINKLLNNYYDNHDFYTKKDLISLLDDFMNKHNYNYTVFSENNIYFNKEYRNRFVFQSFIHKIKKDFYFYKKRIPGFFYKLYFFILKFWNRIKFYKIKKKFGFVQEFNKCNAANGCLYFYRFKNKQIFSVIKAMDHFKTFHNEELALNRLNKQDNLFFPQIISCNKNYYVEESYLSGIDLNTFLKEKSLDKKNALTIILFLINILDILYEKQIIHRDIRPQNIIVEIFNQDIKRVYLIDFGFSIISGKDSLNFKKYYDKRILKALGDHYKPDQYLYDDAVSSINLLEEIIPNVYTLFPKEMSILKGKVGRLVFACEGSKFL